MAVFRAPGAFLEAGSVTTPSAGARSQVPVVGVDGAPASWDAFAWVAGRLVPDRRPTRACHVGRPNRQREPVGQRHDGHGLCITISRTQARHARGGCRPVLNRKPTMTISTTWLSTG